MEGAIVRFAVGCGGSVIGLAVMVLCGWALNIPFLKTVLTGYAAMVPWTAMALVLLGTALIGMALRDRWRLGHRLQWCGALVAGTLASIMLLEYATGADFGVDGLVFGASVAEQMAQFPGRMAGATAALSLVLALALIADGVFTRGGRLYRALTNFGLLGACLPLLGYAFSAKALYASVLYSAMAPYTAAALVILFVGALAARPAHGWVALAFSDSLGGLTTRRLLPVVIGVPLAMAVTLLWIGRLTHMAPDFRLAIVTVGVTGILLTLVVRFARRIERLDRQRQSVASALARAENEVHLARTMMASEVRIRAIIDGTLDAFVGVDGQGMVVAFNHGAEALFALPAAELLGRALAGSELPEPLRHCFAETLCRIGAGEPVVRESLDIEGVRADGRRLVAEANLFTAGAGAGLMIIACLRDISERRRADKKSQRLSRILKTMSEGNQALVRATDENELFQAMCRVIVEFGGYRMAWIGLVEHDADQSLRPVAHAGRETGYLALAKISWADTPRGRGPSGLSIRTGVPQFNNDFTDNPAMSPWRGAALERGYLSSISLPLKDKAGVLGALTIYAGEPHAFGPDEVKLLVELAEDVSFGIMALRTRRDHDEMERALRQAQKMEALGHLTGGIAHDFNNLLQIILANLDLSLGRLNGEAAVAGYVQNAISGAEQGARLTGQLLAFARRQPLQPEPLRLDRLIGDMTGLLRRTLGERIAIELVAGGDLWTAMVDSNQLQNALLNLAINARDAMPEGGRLTIELGNSTLDPSYTRAHRDVMPGQYVLLAVSDTGTGMPPEVLEHVFEPFFTTKAEGAGTGLGLSMVYGFVKQTGGHIKIYSEAGLGTTVKLYLPRTHRTETLDVVEEAQVERGHGEVILVAEDDDGVRASVVTQLAGLGYRVLAAANGEDALDVLAREERVDLLFTDVVMPGALNGRGLADRARTLAPSLPVLYTSGYTENAIIHHGRLDAGVTLLSKPYRLTQLARAVRTALARAPAPAAATAAPLPPLAPFEVSPAPAPAPQASLLLVEDDDMVRFAMVALLEERGYRILPAAKPSEALQMLDDDAAFDVLVTDFTLPEMNGASLISQVLARRPDLAVILTSGHSLEVAELPSRPITVLLKPFHPQALQLSIEKALAARRGEGYGRVC